MLLVLDLSSQSAIFLHLRRTEMLQLQESSNALGSALKNKVGTNR